MKKSIIFSAAVCSLFLLTACGSQNSSSKPSSSSSAVSKTSESSTSSSSSSTQPSSKTYKYNDDAQHAINDYQDAIAAYKTAEQHVSDDNGIYNSVDDMDNIDTDESIAKYDAKHLDLSQVSDDLQTQLKNVQAQLQQEEDSYKALMASKGLATP